MWLVLPSKRLVPHLSASHTICYYCSPPKKMIIDDGARICMHLPSFLFKHNRPLVSGVPHTSHIPACSRTGRIRYESQLAQYIIV